MHKMLVFVNKELQIFLILSEILDALINPKINNGFVVC